MYLYTIYCPLFEGQIVHLSHILTTIMLFFIMCMLLFCLFLFVFLQYWTILHLLFHSGFILCQWSSSCLFTRCHFFHNIQIYCGSFFDRCLHGSICSRFVKKSRYQQMPVSMSFYIIHSNHCLETILQVTQENMNEYNSHLFADYFLLYMYLPNWTYRSNN